MIQIITNNSFKYNEFDKKKFLISEMDKFQSFDNYEITIIDISDEYLWKNNADDENTINRYTDFLSLKNSISRSRTTNILIVFPQNILYSYWYKNGKYIQEKKIKDCKENIIRIINDYLIDMSTVRIEYGKTYSKIGNIKYKGDFSFINVLTNNVLIKAENNNDIMVIKKDKKCLITTLEINTEEEIINLLKNIFPENFKKGSIIPSWIKEIEFYTDSKYKEEINKIDKEINNLNSKKRELKAELSKNEKYKSILYETGSSLSEQVNIMLSEIFDYDNSGFKDTYEEDGCIKLEDITFIVETKGLNNEVSGSNVSDAYHHLVMYEDKLEKENIKENAKCLFIVAYERNKSLQERAEIKERQVKIASANNTLIIDTKIFLGIFEDFLNKKIDKEDVKKLFKENTGVLKYYNL